MAKNRRLSPNQITEELGYFTNLKNMTGYKSQNPDFTVESIQTDVDALNAALDEETQLLARLARVRDTIAEKGTSITRKNDGAALQAAAQFGEDSPQVQSLGRKRKSERAAGGRRKTDGNSKPNG